MTITAIEGVAPRLATSMEHASVGAPNPEGFASMLLQGITRVDARLQSAEQAVSAFAVGNDTPPHQVLLALDEARRSLELALQVRARLVEGYQELMRMQL